ncbi:MAG: hypothetical protein ACFFAS_04335 [Promethearchaeota archaeon]
MSNNEKNIKPTRKTALEIIAKIFEVLQDNKLHTISDISRQSNIHWKSIKNQLDIILKVQDLPKIELLEASKQLLVRVKLL